MCAPRARCPEFGVLSLVRPRALADEDGLAADVVRAAGGNLWTSSGFVDDTSRVVARASTMALAWEVAGVYPVADAVGVDHGRHPVGPAAVPSVRCERGRRIPGGCVRGGGVATRRERARACPVRPGGAAGARRVRRMTAAELLLAVETLEEPPEDFTDSFRLDGERLFSWRLRGAGQSELEVHERTAARRAGACRVLAGQAGRRGR